VACSFLDMQLVSFELSGLGFHLLLKLQSGGLSSLLPQQRPVCEDAARNTPLNSSSA